MYYPYRLPTTPHYMASRQLAFGGQQMPGQQAGNPACTTQRCHTTGQDYGPGPYVTNIEDATLANPHFRTTLWTGNHLQLTQMCIGAGGEIGLEMHPDTDQFLRIEQGRGRIMAGSAANNLSYQRDVADNTAVFVPAGTWHNMINTGNEPIKLYTIYAPPHHPAGTIHCTKADSDQYAD